jgi:hypothetical protein
VLPTPRKLPKVLGIVDPSDFRVGENVAEVLPEATSRRPVVAAGNWVRIEAGTVNVLAPAVVIQKNVVELVTWLAPVPVLVEEADDLHHIRRIAAGPVDSQGRAADHRGGQAARDGERRARASEVLNDPTSVPPAPFKV